MPGWICLHRKIQQSTVWNLEPFSRGQAWVDLLLSANHDTGVFLFRGIPVTVKRGQVGLSEETLARKWKWSRGKVRRFLFWLENEGQIVQQKNNVCSLLTITNYNDYQERGTANSTANGTANGQQTVQQTDTNNKEEQELNNENHANNNLPSGRKRRRKIDYCEAFEKFWNAYPRREAKAKAYEAWVSAGRDLKQRMNGSGAAAAEFLQGRVDAYAESRRVSTLPFEKIPHPATWLNQARYDDDPTAWEREYTDGKTAKPAVPTETPDEKAARLGKLWEEQDRAAGRL